MRETGRKAKLNSALLCYQLILHWQIDGCPIGGDDEQIVNQKEVELILRMIDKRIKKWLKPNN